MENLSINVSAVTHHAFAVFLGDKSSLALPFSLVDNNRLEACATIHKHSSSFQLGLNELESHLDTLTPAYIVLRRKDSLTFITYVPYRANNDVRNLLLKHRHDVVRQLGPEHISSSIICKEIVEITDVRSWVERDADTISHNTADSQGDSEESCASAEHTEPGTKDTGYKKNKCRLCDRRMKNKISPESLSALKTLQTPGAAVQISLNTTTSTLELTYTKTALQPTHIASTLPLSTPSFTFYRHPTTQLLYFIFHSPDRATVQDRMKHTLAIPGLVNVHAADQDVHVDQKLEIHDRDDLVFEGKDERVGRFRSLYVGKRGGGTESVYDGLEKDMLFYEDV